MWQARWLPPFGDCVSAASCHRAMVDKAAGRRPKNRPSKKCREVMFTNFPELSRSSKVSSLGASVPDRSAHSGAHYSYLFYISSQCSSTVLLRDIVTALTASTCIEETASWSQLMRWIAGDAHRGKDVGTRTKSSVAKELQRPTGCCGGVPPTRHRIVRAMPCTMAPLGFLYAREDLPPGGNR